MTVRSSHGAESYDRNVRAERDRLLAAECYGTVFSEVKGFVDAIYPKLSDTVAREVLKNLYDDVAKKWKHWPEDNEMDVNVFAWLERLQTEIARASNGLSSHVVLHGHLAPRGSSAPRRPDLAFIDQKSNFPCRNPSCCNSSTSDVKCPQPNLYWRHIRAFGELKKNPDEIGKTKATHAIVVSLMDRAREIFEAQPTRRCVQCFTLGGDLLRCFIIDRAGIIGSKAFSIHRSKRIALRVFSAFFTADITWYGLDPTIYAEIGGNEHVYDCTAQHMDGVEPFIKVPFQPIKNSNAPLDRLYIDLKHPIFSRSTVISRGTLLWKARKSGQAEWRYVVKDMWRNSERPNEGDFLKTVGSQPGICGYYHHLDINIKRSAASAASADTASGIRGGLDLTNADSILPDNALPLPGYHFGSKPSSSKLAEQVMTYETHDGKRKQPQASQTLKKRLRPDSKAARDEDAPPESNHDPPKPYSRTHSRLIMQSVGRPLDTFATATELLRAIRAALYGHRYLQSIGILHRDVSINNILLPAEGDDSEGFLIDFDYAMNLERGTRSGAPHRTGTPMFMAIGVLEDEPPSFCYDLHSFFYVLLWIITKHDVPGSNVANDNPRNTQISRWPHASYFHLCKAKKAMLADHTDWQQYKQEALEQPGWKARKQAMEPLLDDWLNICFPEKNVKVKCMGRITKLEESWPMRVWKAEDLDLDQMYNMMIEALDLTIQELDGR